MDKYVIGLDFGTLSCRAVLVRVKDGYEISSSVCNYPNGVMSSQLMNTGINLKKNWALENPDDYIISLQKTIPEVIHTASISPTQVIGIGVDFTSCTILPVDKSGLPLSDMEHFKNRPHAYAKLWKHHAAQYEADKINKTLRYSEFLKKYHIDSKVSSELFAPKVMQILDEDPEVYDKADYIMEAGDWITFILTGSTKRSISMASYKAWWSEENGYPERVFWELLDSRMGNFADDKLQGEICKIGEPIGYLNKRWADTLGLAEGTAVAPSIIDSHAGVPGSGICKNGQVMLVVGTSSVIIGMSDTPYSGAGIIGSIQGTILPHSYAIESGIAAVGDSLSWFISNYVPNSYIIEAQQNGISVFDLLSNKATSIKKSEIVILDWLSGNKTPYIDSSLKSGCYGISLDTKPEEIYKAIVEGSAFGTKRILSIMEEFGYAIEQVIVSGGISRKSPLFMQIYADVLNRDLYVSNSTQTAALGSAIYAAVAAGNTEGGYNSMNEAVSKMTTVNAASYTPNIENRENYNSLYNEYCKMSDFFANL